MPRPTCPTPPFTRGLAPADLELLADHLVGAHEPGQDGPAGPALIRARPTPDGIDLALCPLPAGTHPADVLVGHVVPPRWNAAGLVASAVARGLSEEPAEARRVTVALLLGRDGSLAHRSVADEGHDVVPRHDAPEGRLVDLLHRALGLPTPPCGASPRRLWEALWLDAVVAGAARGDDRGLAPELADALATTSAPEGRGGWSHLRHLASSPTADHRGTDAALAAALGPLIDADAAAWMDDGSFARWVLGALPPIDDLLEAVDALLPAERANAVRVALGASLGLPHGHRAR